MQTVFNKRASESVITIVWMFMVLFSGTLVPANSTTATLVSVYKGALEELKRNPGPENTSGEILRLACHRGTPEEKAAARQAILETFHASSAYVRRKSFWYLTMNFENDPNIEQDSLKSLVLEIIMGENYVNEEFLMVQAIDAISMLALTPQEYEALLARSFVIDSPRVGSETITFTAATHPLRTVFDDKHHPLRRMHHLRDDETISKTITSQINIPIPVTSTRVGRAWEYGNLIQRELAMVGGAVKYEQLKNRLQSKPGQLGSRATSEPFNPSTLLGSQHPEAYRDLLAFCRRGFADGTPPSEIRLLPASLVSKNAPYTAIEREEILAMCRAVALNEKGNVRNDVRDGLILALGSTLQKFPERIDPAVVEILEASREYWQQTHIGIVLKIDENIQKYRARRAAAGEGS